MARSTDKRWKGILIDWPTIADMDAVDYELKPLNQQQVAILLALLEYQKWPTRWTNLEMSKDELETYIADIEERLMRNEGGGMATKEDVRDGMYEAMNRLAAQVVSGRYTNILVGDDGTVSNPQDEGDTPAPLPEDDPTTPYDDTLAAQMGGTIAVTRALELLYDKLDTYYGGVSGTPATPEADTFVFIKEYFPCDENAMSTAISAYYAYRMTQPVIGYSVSAVQQNFMFCKGGGESSWKRWLGDLSGYALAKFNVVTLLSNALAPEFWSGYFAEGASKPSTQYFDASCVPVATQTLLNLLFGVARNTTPLKALHRMDISVKGYATDTDGDIQDFFWFRTAAGVNTRQNPSFVHSAGANMPSDNQVVYNTAHEYRYTIDLGNLNNFAVVTMNKHANLNAVGLVQNVPFEMTLIDLGEYSV